MTMSIVIVAFNAREDLGRCVASLQDAPASIPHDITIVDNASTDGGAEAVSERWPDIRVIRLDANRGFAAGNNVGIRATRGDLVLLLNSDTLVPAGAIDTLVSRLQAHPSAAVAGPRLVDKERRTEISFGAMISPFAELRQKLIGRLYVRRVPFVRSRVEHLARTERYVDWVSGACLLVRRVDAEAVGLLDERYFLYTEDVDFCAAIRASGRQVLFTPAAEVVHLRGRSRSSAPAAMSAAYRRSQLAFYEKHHPRWAAALRAYLRLKGELPER
jgi:GT2 family glycosyltransferase